MQRLRESWTFGPTDFQNHCKKLDESSYGKYHISQPKLKETCSTKEILKAGARLRESLSDPASIDLLDQILKALQDGGADSTFKVWRIPVAKYDHKNLNGRIYPLALWQNIKDNQQDIWKGLCGLADHPEGDDPGLFRDQSVVWHDMEVGDDGVVYGVCSFVGPYGHLAQEILEHGGRIGTSSSGFGDVDPVTSIVDPNTYQVERLADLVLNPSQGTYGCSADPHVSPKDFAKDVTKPAVMDFTGNKPIKEAAPKSKILQQNNSNDFNNNNNNNNNTTGEQNEMAKADAANNNTPVNNNNKLSKVEEKAFRQYVEKFLEDANNLDNPLKRLNECADILSCFEEGNCPDLKEKVESRIIEEKDKLEQLVESTSKIQNEYGMTAEEFKAAAERNTEQGLLLNEQVADYKALVEELSKRNAALKEENDNLHSDLERQSHLTEEKVKKTNKSVVKTLDENDKLNALVESLRGKNSRLHERITELCNSNNKLEKSNGILETKLKEAASIIKNGRRVRESTENDLNDTEKQLKDARSALKKESALREDTQEKLDAMTKKYTNLLQEFKNYKEGVTDLMDPTKHVMPSASQRIGRYLGNLQENEGSEIALYLDDLKEKYGPSVSLIEDEILNAKTLREATSVFLKNRNKIIKEFRGTAPVEGTFRNEADRDRIYEQVGMLNPKVSYAQASLEEKNAEFRKSLDAQGLL